MSRPGVGACPMIGRLAMLLLFCFRRQKLLHLGGFTDAERSSFRDIIHNNVLIIIKALVTACRSFEYKFDKPIGKLAKRVEELDPSGELTPDVAEIISQLWKDANVRKAHARYAEFQLSVAAE